MMINGMGWEASTRCARALPKQEPNTNLRPLKWRDRELPSTHPLHFSWLSTSLFQTLAVWEPQVLSR